MKQFYVRNLLVCLMLLLGFQLKAADYYWVNGGGNWSDLNHWRLGSSGGAIPSIVPSSGDNVFFDANSGFGTTAASKTVTLNGNGFCNNMTWANVPNSPQFITASASFTVQVQGSLSLSPTTTYHMMFAFKGASAATLTTNGTVLGEFGMEIDKPGSSLTLTDNLVVPAVTNVNGTNAVTFASGTFDVTGKTVTIFNFYSVNNNVRSLQMANANFTASLAYRLSGLNKTINATGSTLTNGTFVTDGGTYHNVNSNCGAGPSTQDIRNTTFSSITFTYVSGASFAALAANNTADVVVFRGQGELGTNNKVGSVRFQMAGALNGTGNVIGKIECLNTFQVKNNFINTVDDMLLAPNYTTTFRGTFNINKSLSVPGASCAAFTEINGDPTTGTVNFAAGAVADLNNVILTGVKATGPITPIAVNGVDGGGNTGFNITEPSGSGTALYWVGGAGNWNDQSHWSTSSGGPGGACIPFKNDNVFFDANSGLTGGGIVTTSSTSFCKDMTWAPGVGTVTFNESAASFRVYGSVVLQPGVTMNSALEFYGTDASTITTNGGGAGSLQFYIIKTGTGSVTLMDDWINTGTGSAISFYSGNLSLADRKVMFWIFVSNNNNSRNLDISNATITANLRWIYLGNNKSMTSTKSHITGNGLFQVNNPGSNYPRVDLTSVRVEPNNFSIVGTTFGQLTFTSPSTTSVARILNGNAIRKLEFKGAGTIGNTGNSIDSLIMAGSKNYTFVGTNTISKYIKAEAASCTGLTEMRGSPTSTLAFGSTAVIDINNVYMQNMTATGAMTPIAINGADAGGNSGWTINSAAGAGRYWVGGAGDWNDSSHWSTSSGGPGGACVPTVYDDVYFNAASGFTPASKTVTINNGNAYCRNIDWTGAANAPVWSKAASWTIEAWGDKIILNPAATFNLPLTLKGNNAASLQGTVLGNFDVYIDKTGGSLTLLNDLNNNLMGFSLINGALNASGRTLNIQNIDNGAFSTVTSINISNSIITADMWQYAGPVANHTLNASNSSITAGTFIAEGFQYNTVNVSGLASNSATINTTTITKLSFTDPSAVSAAGINGDSNTLGTVEYKGSGGIYGTANAVGKENNINTLIFFPGKKYTITAGTTTNITGDWFASGTPCNLTEIVSSSASVNATINKTGGAPEFDYLRVRRITAAGSTPFIGFNHTIDQGNNTNWSIAPYDGVSPIIGLGPDKILLASEFPYTINAAGFFASPLAAFAWRKDGVLLGDTGPELVVTGPGTYTANVTYPDGCAISDQIVISRAAADLSVVKTANSMTPAVGSDVVFTLAATNNGPQQSTGISVTDLLAAGYTYKSSTSPAGTTYDAGTGVWTIGTLASGANATLTITATVKAAGPYVNTAAITGPEVDSVPANNSSTITPVPVPTADVSATKTVDQSSPLVGSNVVFTLTASNAGPSGATSVALTDLLPNGYTYVSSVIPAGTTYNPVNGLWTIGTLANGANATATITATVNATGTYANTAAVTLTENDPVPSNNTATVTPVPIPQANLSIVKTINSSAPYAGNNVIFTITAANAGPSNATGVQVHDLLASGYTFVSATPSQGAYNPSTGIWTVGTLANAANATLTITATVKDVGVYANTASITATETDPVPANNSSTVTPTPIIIKVTKTGPATVNAGSGVQYVLSIKNSGTGNALAAVIADVVPAELTNVSWTTALQGAATISSGATGTGNNLSVTGNIPAGAANQIDVTVTGTIPAASAATSVSNTATVTAPGSPVISSNTVITAIGREVDLHLQKSGPAVVVAGSTVAYTLHVTNSGPSDASNVAITDNIPAGLNNVTWTATAQNGAVINGASAGTGNVSILAYVPAGTASVSVIITGTLDASYAGANLVNTATASPAAGVTDPTPASSTITSTVSRTANIRIIKSGPANIGAGENIAYTLRVTNDGPSNAAGIEIKDVIPAEVLNPTWTATVQNGATLSALAGTGNINLTGSIPAGTGLIEIVISGQANPALSDASTFSNTATANLPAGSPVSDPEPTSNSSTIQTTVNNTPDIRVSKNGPATVNVGDPVTYTIVITNGGAGNVTGAAIVDNVPASVTVANWNIVAAGGAAVTGTASGTTNAINTTGNIPANPLATLTLTVQGTVNVNAAPLFTNTVTVTAGGVATSSVATAVNQSTDVVVEKNGPQAVIAGRPISYTIKLGNAGPRNAQGLVLNDVVPAAVQHVSWSAATVGSAVINSPSSGSTNTVMVNADVNAGAGNYVLITVNGTVSPSTLPSTISNTASVTLPGGLTDFDLANNTSVVNTVVSRETNLAVTKIVNNIAPDAGSNVVFTLVASNNGPSDATGVKIADLLPAGYTYVSSTPPAGTTYSAITGEWTIGTLANAASSTLTITATVNAAGSYANTATITGTEPDPILANNTATVTPVPVPVTDLAITKTADNLTPNTGSNIVFTLVASNNGPSAATGVSVSDLLPAGYTYVGSTPPAGTTYDPVTGVWAIGTLANAGSSTLTITATVKASGPYANTATISGTENDPAAANNTATITPTTAAVADLAITKTADDLTPNVGGNVVFTLVATNNGASGATGVAVTDLLPAGYAYVSSTAPGTSYVPVTGLWTIGTLANGASATLTITATVNPSGPYGNTAVISGAETDLVPANNTATVTPVPVPAADLVIAKTADNLRPNAGSNIIFSLVATNNGPSGATGVTVTDLLPAGYTYVGSAAPAGTSYDPATGIWTVGTLGNGTSSTLTITATVHATGPYANTASISGTETDPSVANNTATVTPVPAPVTDLMVVKTVDNANPAMGSNVVFTLVATNNGPSGATGVKVNDLLPTGYTYVSSAPAAGTSYDAATGVWTVGTLTNAASSTLTITARVNVTGLYANSAVISGTETDLVAANNTSSVTPVPVPLTDLMVVKTADKPSAAVGSNIVFSVVASNNGPSDASAVVVNDLLPSGYTYVSSVAEPGTSYDELTGIWSIGSLANGANATLAVTATMNASGDYTNNATISGAENDPVAANNTATTTPVAEPVTDLSVAMTGSDLAPITGSNMSFEIMASNNGPSGATGITVTDLLPVGYTYVSSTAPAGTSYNPATGVWTIAALSSTESMTLSITARVNAAGPYANTATITGTEADPVTANNTVTVTPVPAAVTDLAIVKTVDQANPPVGTNVVFTLVATNNGPSPATGVTVTDLLAAGYTYINAIAPAGTAYVPATGLWTIGALANGASSTLTITARVNATGPYANTATISGVEQDLVAANNASAVTPGPQAQADLVTVKTLKDPAQISVVPGQAVVYVIKVTNNGPSSALSVNIRDAAPAGTTISSWTTVPAAGIVYPNASGTGNLNETIAVLNNGLTATYEVTVQTLVSLSGSLTNTVQVSSPTSDPNPGCTSCTQILTVLAPPNTAPTLAVIADQQVCYSSASQTVALTGITAGNEQGQTVTLSVSSNNPGLFSSLTVTPGTAGNASLNYVINNRAGGTALITVTVKDNGGTLHGGSDTFSRSFTLAVSALPELHIAADPGSNVSKGQTIVLTASGASSYSWANAAGILSGQNSATLTVRPAQTTTYTVTGTSAAGCISTQEITITVMEDYNLVANNVLTPNGDGKNDFFTVKNIDMYPNNEVRIFDRAGRSVYSKRGYNNEWDGTLNGTPLDEDTYYYIIDFGNGVKVKKGFISIVRKY